MMMLIIALLLLLLFAFSDLVAKRFRSGAIRCVCLYCFNCDKHRQCLIYGFFEIAATTILLIKIYSLQQLRSTFLIFNAVVVGSGEPCEGKAVGASKLKV